MILSPHELQWVTERMKIYDIKYQESYFEILDHILTAIETKRDNGDTRDISVVFQDVVDTDFGGYSGIEALAVKQENIYNKYIGGVFKAIFRGYLNWGLLVFTIVISALAYTLPDNKAMHGVFFIAILLLAFSPLLYAFLLISRKGTSVKGKKSLLKGRLISQTYLPGMLLNGIIYLPVLFKGGDDVNGFKIMQHWPLPALMVILIFFAVLNLSSITLCNQVLKKRG
ncbi:hypothetical protein IDJ75_13275 [Mucilaginibacter rigui]|uniref:DUF1129 family protein n=1 Tax=Mucilaginibacter rigui TaxID=534635 RepID=A0ABR7X6W7_9SPHI|nr:hypothetical protein [Mucilaginibacter rigui]MBD1386251.1 hypothetical protein [Mucilaginibacter rigui]